MDKLQVYSVAFHTKQHVLHKSKQKNCNELVVQASTTDQVKILSLNNNFEPRDNESHRVFNHIPIFQDAAFLCTAVSDCQTILRLCVCILYSNACVATRQQRSFLVRSIGGHEKDAPRYEYLPSSRLHGPIGYHFSALWTLSPEVFFICPHAQYLLMGI